MLFKAMITAALIMVASYAEACEAQLASLAPTVELKTLEQQLTTSVTFGDEQLDTEVYQLIDFVGRRIYQRTDGFTGELIVRYQDGEVSVQLPGMAALPGLPELAETLEPLFEDAFALGGLPQHFELIRCDGPRSYAGLVSGEQVTVRTLLPDEEGQLVAEEARLLFHDGEPVALLFDSQAGELLAIYEMLERDAAGMIVYLRIQSYLLEGEVAEPFSRAELRVLSYNAPIDETLFE